MGILGDLCQPARGRVHRGRTGSCRLVVEAVSLSRHRDADTRLRCIGETPGSLALSSGAQRRFRGATQGCCLHSARSRERAGFCGIPEGVPAERLQRHNPIQGTGPGYPSKRLRYRESNRGGEHARNRRRRLARREHRRGWLSPPSNRAPGAEPDAFCRARVRRRRPRGGVCSALPRLLGLHSGSKCRTGPEPRGRSPGGVRSLGRASVDSLEPSGQRDSGRHVSECVRVALASRMPDRGVGI